MIRYRDGKIVSTKGERFTQVTKAESEEMKKSYVNMHNLDNFFIWQRLIHCNILHEILCFLGYVAVLTKRFSIRFFNYLYCIYKHSMQTLYKVRLKVNINSFYFASAQQLYDTKKKSVCNISNEICKAMILWQKY